MRIALAILTAVAGLVASISAHAGPRVAFVVGIGAYRQVPALPNPALDARAMADLLRAAGLEVVDAIDVDGETRA